MRDFEKVVCVIFKSCMQDFEKGVYVILIIGMRFLKVVCVILKKGLLRWSRSRGEINLATGSATQINTTSRWASQRCIGQLRNIVGKRAGDML